MSSVYQSVIAWRQALESLLSLGRSLPDTGWAAPTECPKWSVKDIYSHLVGGEQWMADGHPRPEQGFDAWVAEPVSARRETPPSAVLDELRLVYERRRVQLESEPIAADAPAYFPNGAEVTFGRLLQFRVFDIWMHEQDVRRAVSRPGNLDSPGAAVTGELLMGSLPRIVAKDAKAPPGATVRLTTHGGVGIDVAVSVDRQGRATLVAPGRSATCQLSLSWEAYTRLSGGRGERTDYDVKIAGDRALAERVLDQLAVTP